MELIRFQCPGCGAELPPRDPSSEQHCEYCDSRFAPEGARGAKTVAGVALAQAALLEHIQAARKQLIHAQTKLARVEAREAETRSELEEERRKSRGERRRERKRERKQKRERRGLASRLIGGVFQLLALAVGIGGILVALSVFDLDDVRFLRDQILGEELRKELADEGADPWGGPPALREIAGEAAVVLRIRDHANSQLFVDAYALDDGQRLWRIGPLSTGDSELEHVRFATAGDFVVVSPATERRAFIHDLHGGQRTRSVDLRGRVAYLCTTPQDPQRIYVRVDGRAHRLLDPRSGELSKAAAPPEGCEPARRDSLDATTIELDALRVQVDDLKVLGAHRLAGPEGEARNLIIARRESDAAPRLLGFAAPDKPAAKPRLRDTDLQWSRDDFEAPEGFGVWPAASALIGARLFVAWRHRDAGWVVGAWRASDGVPQWTAAIETDEGDRVIALAGDERHLLVSRAHVLEVRDAETGALVTSIGGPP